MQSKKIKLAELRVLRQLESKSHIQCSKDAFEAFREAWSDDMMGVESFFVMALNRANNAVKIAMISKGGFHSTIVDPKVVFTIGLESMASALIVAHNHPSNRTEPSPEDRRITKKLRDVGRAMEMPVLDHIILAGDGQSYYSFADNGTLDTE